MHQHAQAWSRRRALAVAGLSLLVLAAAGSEGAVSVSTTVSETSLSETRIRLQTKVEYSVGMGAQIRKMTYAPWFDLPAGRAGGLGLGFSEPPGPDQLQLEFSAEPQAEGRVLVSVRVSRGTPQRLVSLPRVLTLDGQPAVIEIGDQAPDNAHHLRVEVTPTVRMQVHPTVTPAN